MHNLGDELQASSKRKTETLFAFSNDFWILKRIDARKSNDRKLQTTIIIRQTPQRFGIPNG